MSLKDVLRILSRRPRSPEPTNLSRGHPIAPMPAPTADNAGPAEGGEAIVFDVPEIPLPPRVYNLALPALAAFVATSVVILLVAIVFKDIPITKLGDLSDSHKRIYTTGTTVAATLIAWLISSQIKLLWLDEIELLCPPPSHVLLRRKRDALLGVARDWDEFRFWPVTATLLIAALVTAAVTAGVSPGEATVRETIFYDPTDIAYNLSLSDSLVEVTPLGWYTWPWNETHTYHIEIAGDSCEDGPDDSSCDGNYQYPVPLVQSLFNLRLTAQGLTDGYIKSDTYLGWDLAFTRLKYIFRKNAIAVPVNVLNVLFDTVLAGTGNQRTSVELCLPVVTRNPVRCTATGKISIYGNQLSVLAAGCNHTDQIYACDPSDASCGATVMGVCPGERIGEVTIVMGSVNSHATALIDAAYDPDGDSPRTNLTEYSVACRVSRPYVSFRRIVADKIRDYSHDAEAGEATPGIEYVVSADGEDACTPHSGSHPGGRELTVADFYSNESYASSAAGTYDVLTQNFYSTGWWGDLYKAADQIYGATPTVLDLSEKEIWNLSRNWNESHNKLEEALGMLTAMSLSDGFVSWNDPPKVCCGTARYTIQKVGSSGKVALLFVLPVLFSLCVLLNLIRRRMFFFSIGKRPFSKLILSKVRRTSGVSTTEVPNEKS